MQGELSWGEGACDQGRWGSKGIFASQQEAHFLTGDHVQGRLPWGEGACNQGRRGSQGIFALHHACFLRGDHVQGAHLGVKEIGIEEDGEVRASLRLCVVPVSSEEIMCKDDCFEVKELAIKEDTEVEASLLLCKKPVSSEEIMCKEDCLD
eukprot:7934454-Ditylum_brightwellii.AAC.1